MKKTIFLTCIITCLTICMACSSSDNNREQESSSYVDMSDKFHLNGVATVTKDTLELSLGENKNVYHSYDAIVVDCDGGSAEKRNAFNEAVCTFVKQRWTEERESENLFPTSLTSIKLQFTDDIPKSLRWRQFYLDEIGRFSSSSNLYFVQTYDENGELQFVGETCEVKNDTYEEKIEGSDAVLSIGFSTNMIPLHSSDISGGAFLYRMIYLECNFEDETRTYAIIFDKPFKSSAVKNEE